MGGSLSEPCSPAAGQPDPGCTGSWHTLTPEAGARREGAAGASEAVALRCWLVLPRDRPVRSGVLVLPEVFGINGWVRSVAARLAAAGHAALAVPLFARTAPELELGYDEASLALGRAHKERTCASELLTDLSLAADWLAGHLADPDLPLGCVGFCFGGHGALLAASLPRISASCNFYGAGVVTGRPGGGAPSLELVPQIRGRLLCFCGDRDPLIPEAEVQAIERALAAAPDPGRHRLIRVAGAGHGYMCEARADHCPEQAAAGWQQLLAFLAESLAVPRATDG